MIAIVEKLNLLANLLRNDKKAGTEGGIAAQTSSRGSTYAHSSHLDPRMLIRLGFSLDISL